MTMIDCPAISVIISYHNESVTLKTTLDLLVQQTRPPQEVILVDSSSTDKSFQMIQEWIEHQSSKTSIVFRNLQKGTFMPSSSMNVGILQAKHKLLAFMDCGLLFEPDWLEKQVKYMIKYDAEVVSGVCYFEGTTLLDRSVIAQTYGYKRHRPAVPSTLVKKQLFDKTGIFLENKRAGYDVDWIGKLYKHKIQRHINKKVIVRYNGINYTNSIKSLFVKIIKYSDPIIGVYNYYYPYYHLLLFVVFLIIFSSNPLYGIFFFLCYFSVRGYVIPIYKSKNMKLYQEYPLSLVTLPVIGFLIDIAKLIGYVKGITRIIFRK